jgi:hypothetical protein
MANGIIGLDNITNIATGLDKELLDMTYSDKYYRDVIQPAKLGKGPMPSRMEMISQSLKNFGPFKAMGIGMRPDIYGERAMPTKAAQKFLNTVGSAAKFGINRVAPLFGIFSSTELGADDVITPEMRDKVDITDELDDYYEKGEMMDNVAEARDRNLLEKALDFIPFIGDKSLSGILLNALGGAKDKLTGFRDAVGRRLGPAPFGTSQAAYNALTPSQQQMVESVYGQGGIMQGYNPVSAFGRGPRGAIENRIANILGRKAPQTAASRAKVKQLQQALTDIGGGDSGDSGGYSQSAVDAGIQAAEDDI